jgi:hypothetical protein
MRGPCEVSRPSGQKIITVGLDRLPPDSTSQQAGPNEAPYNTASPISRTTIHGQERFLQSPFMPGF